MGDRLHEPDHGEERGEPDRNHGEGSSHPVGERRSGDDGEEGGEREQEVRQLVLARVEVLRPEERERREREEGDRRDRDERGDGSQLAAAERAPGERERGRAEHGVEREQSSELSRAGCADEEAVLAAERERWAERRGGDDEGNHDDGIAHEDRRSDGHDREPREGERGETRRDPAPVVGELEHEDDLGPREQGEPGEERPAAPREQDESCANRPDERRNLGRISRLHATNGKQTACV